MEFVNKLASADMHNELWELLIESQINQRFRAKEAAL